MIDFYLVTGFLGAGKTTFLKEFIKMLKPLRIHLIINEFGKQGVDGTLLSEVGAVMDEINNGSIFCTCKADKFESVLNSAINTKPDVIIAEASGLADPTSVNHVLSKFSQINYKASICLADAVRLEKVYDTAIVCKRQLAVSGLVLLNKTDVATPEQCQKSEELIKMANPLAVIKKTQFGKIQQQWLNAAVKMPNFEDVFEQKDITLQKISVEISEDMTMKNLKGFLGMVADASYRMKGFVKIKQGVFHVDCTGPDIQIKQYNKQANNILVLLAGKGMPLRKAVNQAIKWYDKLAKIHTEI